MIGSILSSSFDLSCSCHGAVLLHFFGWTVIKRNSNLMMTASCFLSRTHHHSAFSFRYFGLLPLGNGFILYRWANVAANPSMRIPVDYATSEFPLPTGFSIAVFLLQTYCRKCCAVVARKCRNGQDKAKQGGYDDLSMVTN